MRSAPVAAPFPWYGGKSSHLGWLLPIVDATPHRAYVEPFGGSAAVLLAKRPAAVETYNDAHGEVVNFFRVLRDRTDALVAALDRTPYARAEFEASLSGGEADDLERARRFFVIARQVRSGLATTATRGRWACDRSGSRRGVAATVSKWLSAIDGLGAVADRLRGVQIECADALAVLARYDAADALHYVDPPYLATTRTGGRAYGHELDAAAHEALLDLLETLKGRVLLSGYDSDLYRGRLSGWHRIERPTRTSAGPGSASTRTEVLWSNGRITGEQDLFRGGEGGGGGIVIPGIPPNRT